MWACPKCSEQVEGNFEVCWNCGTSRDGTTDPEFANLADEAGESAEAHDKPATPPISCLRCRCDLDHMGTKSFHEGPRWGFIGDLGELFVNKEHFDVYRCPRCGHVEFFIDGVGEQFRPN
ncbi:MAG: hypothetical protein ACT4QC_20945 [Planctomycetaceae bacterium]